MQQLDNVGKSLVELEEEISMLKERACKKAARIRKDKTPRYCYDPSLLNDIACLLRKRL